MEWLSEHWQTAAAGAIVGATLMIFARSVLRKKKPGCGGKCECPKK